MLIPVVLLVPVECGDSSHFAIGQREVENRDVLPDMVGIARTWDGDHAPLQVPPEDNLRYGLIMSGSNLRQNRIAQEFLLMPTPTKRIPLLPCPDNRGEPRSAPILV